VPGIVTWETQKAPTKKGYEPLETCYTVVGGGPCWDDTKKRGGGQRIKGRGEKGRGELPEGLFGRKSRKAVENDWIAERAVG